MTVDGGVRRIARHPAQGRPQPTLGFASGHAGVAAVLCAAALPELGPRDRRLAIAIVTTVAASRLYIVVHHAAGAIAADATLLLSGATSAGQ